ncbi:MAG TPA: hypothetical protein VHW23_38970 [Kofleriaceae bacterium]|jgi:heme exporter protein D|nr:hypothetical protein [Kofleriaceae bacterium]
MVVQRCPRCHRPSNDPAGQCRCSQPPGDGVEHVHAALRAQQAHAWLELALLLVLDAAAAGGFVYAALHGFIVFSALGCTALILLTAREVQRVRAARACLRQLARRHAVLPRAVVHRR